ncbi:UbiA family prenyltransferase [Streptomyces sp. S1]|uniref:UbiA family prenyltransferase n=1 Tax=Streptomyces sp. S1 TaxID=718288 RepID=UPI003D7033AE
MTRSPFPRPAGGRLRAWSELLRVSALLSVPGDALAGAAAVGVRPGRGTAWAVGSSLCLYEAGMALNDWADRHEDAVERPHRPVPSGRVSPGAALGAAGVLTAAGLALAARAGRPPLAVATALAATVWAYDLRLKHTAAGPAAMATARGLDLLLGATATVSAARRGVPGAPGVGGAGGGARRTVGGAGDASRRTAGRAGDASRRTTAGAEGVSRRTAGGAGGASRRTGGGAAGGAPRRTADGAEGASHRTADGAGGASRRTAAPPLVAPPLAASPLAALPSAVVLAAHTYAVTAVSRHEVQGGSTGAPLGALAAATVLGAFTASTRPDPYHQGPAHPAPYGPGAGKRPPSVPRRSTAQRVTPLLAAVYVRTAGRPLLHAALNPSPLLTGRAVGGGIRAMIPLQAALMSRSGATAGGLALLGLVPLTRRLARKVSPT